MLIRQNGRGRKGLVVPDYSQIDRGTLLEIIRQAVLKRDEFLHLLDNR